MTFSFIQAYRIFSLLVVFLFVSVVLRGQSLTGTVEANGEGVLVGANVLLYEADSTSMLSFAITDENGHWELDYPLKAGMVLFASYLGFTSTYVPLKAETIKNKKITIVLESTAERLNEVIVAAKRLSVVVSGDTITYEASAFRKESDRNLGDLLNNMPGVEVDSRGEILYKGKRVDKLLVEGRDILSNQHKLTTEGFQSDDIKAIRFIEDYRPFNEQYLPFSTKAVAMDIQLTDEAKKEVNGDVELRAGHRRAYQAGSNLYRVREKSGFTSFARTNNIGEPTVSQGDFLSLQSDFMKVLNETKGDFSQIIPEGFNPASNVQQNMDNSILANLEKDQLQHGKIRMALMSNFAHRLAESDVERIYDGINSTQSGTATKRTSFPYLYAKLDVNRKVPEKKHFYNLELPMYADLTQTSSFSQGEINLFSTENWLNKQRQNIRIAPQFRFSLHKGEHQRVYFRVDSYFESFNNQIHFRREGDVTLDINQTAREQTGMAGGQIGYSSKKGKWSFSGETGIKAQTRSKNQNSPEHSLNNFDLQHVLWQPNGKASLQFDHAPWRIRAGLTTQHNRHQLDSLAYKNLLLSPSLVVRFQFNILHYFLLQTSLQQQENAHHLAYNTYEFIDENTLRYNSLELGSYSKDLNANISHFWYERDKGIQTHTIGSFSRSNGGAFQDFELDNGLFVQVYSQAITQTAFGFRNNMSWHWQEKKWRFNAGVSWNRNQTETEAYGVIAQQMTTQRIGVRYEPVSSMAFSYTYSANQRQREGARNEQSFTTQNHSTGVILSNKKSRVEATWRYQETNSAYIHNNFMTLDLKTELQLNKNWTMVCVGKDLFNLSPQEIIANSVTATYFETERYIRFPGSITVGVKKLF